MFEYGPHCNGCNAHCKIERKCCTRTIINGTEINHQEIRNTADKQIMYVQQICENLCGNYGLPNVPENASFHIKENITCDGCNERCIITCDPEKSNWVKIGDMHTPGSHASIHDALLYGTQYVKLCKKHNNTNFKIGAVQQNDYFLPRIGSEIIPEHKFANKFDAIIRALILLKKRVYYKTK